jgi:hypothetical protein
VTSLGHLKLGDFPVQVKSLKGKAKAPKQSTSEEFPTLSKPKGVKQSLGNGPEEAKLTKETTGSTWSDTVAKMVEKEEKILKEEQQKKENQEKDRLQKEAEEEKHKQELQKQRVLCPYISQRASFVEETSFVPYGEELCDAHEYETTDEPYVGGWDGEDEEDEDEN